MVKVESKKPCVLDHVQPFTLANEGSRKAYLKQHHRGMNIFSSTQSVRSTSV